MPETILVVEYEPRYTDRVKQALSGQPFIASFARDGEEALRAIATQQPQLIVLSSVIPKTTTTELIRAIRSQSLLQKTPILLTVSGYAGTTPQSDAERVGASDILPKPYSDSEFLGKVQQLLGIPANRPATAQANPDHLIRAAAPTEPGNLTSNDIFGDVLQDESEGERTVVTPPRKTARSTSDVDKMIADTLAGMLPQKKTAPGLPKPPAAGSSDLKPKTEPGISAIDRIVHDTLSGLEKTARVRSTPPAAAPSVPPASNVASASPPPVSQPPVQQPPVPKPSAAPPSAAGPVPTPTPTPAAPSPNKFDRFPVSQPILTAPPPPPVEEEEPVDGVKFGQYVLLEKIATGGMAEVWKARMRGVEGFQKTVAIKKILPHLSDNQDFIEMFVDEAKLAAQLSHNNIIHIYDLGKIQSSYYIAMEYVDGWDLKTILKKAQDHDQPMTVEIALFVASKVAAALDYAHRRRDFNDRELGLVHRDISPQNVLISQEGDIKLCDFGIAKAASKASHTQAGALKGKLQYMSPEQAWGRNIDRRADIFALAAVLFEMLTGRKLFAGENEISILDQVREARVTPPSQYNDEVTPKIDAIVLKALQKEPDDRYQTAGDMAREIDQILYSFRPTPTSADLAIFMSRLSQPEPAVPDLEDTVIAPRSSPAPVAMPPVFEKPAPAPVVEASRPQPEVVSRAPFQQALEPQKKSRALPIGIAAVLVIAAVAGGFFFLRGRSGSTPAPVQKAAAVTPAPAAATSSAAVSDTASTAPASAAQTSTGPAIDPAKVDEEVRKRLEAERQKLEQLSKAQQPKPAAAAPAQVAAATTRPAAQPVVAPPARPVTQTTAPAPSPASETREPAQVASSGSPAGEAKPFVPPPPAEAPARVREGDLVRTSEGLTPPRVVHMAPVTYPPIARAQHVEGSVIIGALISETGQVLETRIISGVNKPGGLNEAAQQTIRRSSFAPGSKDGVRVKSWTTVRVDFKL